MPERHNSPELLTETARRAAITAAIAAGHVVLEYWPSPTNPYYNPNKALGIRAKGNGIGNFATAADHASGAAIREILSKFPALNGITFRTEESAQEHNRPGDWWNIDEIDGTANFSRGSDHFGISIALHGANGTPELGITAFPARQQLIVASKGRGAVLFDFEGIELANLTAHAALLPANPNPNELFVAYDLGYSNKVQQIQTGAVRLAEQVSALKSFHSSSYTLGELIMGKLDAFFAAYPTIYDIGASTAGIEAIGGKVSTMDGEEIDWDAPERTFLAARTPEIHARVLAMLHNT